MDMHLVKKQDLANKDAALQNVANKCPPTWTLHKFHIFVSSRGMLQGRDSLYTQILEESLLAKHCKI